MFKIRYNQNYDVYLILLIFCTFDAVNLFYHRNFKINPEKTKLKFLFFTFLSVCTIISGTAILLILNIPLLFYYSYFYSINIQNYNYKM